MKKCLSKNCTGKCTSIFHDCGLTRPFSSQIQLMGKVKADRTVKGIYPIFRNAMPFFICQLSQSSTIFSRAPPCAPKARARGAP